MINKQEHVKGHKVGTSSLPLSNGKSPLFIAAHEMEHVGSDHSDTLRCFFLHWILRPHEFNSRAKKRGVN